MKVYEIAKGSTSHDGLRQADRPQLECGPRQVRIKVHAASLNYRDQAIVIGQYFGGPRAARHDPAIGRRPARSSRSARASPGAKVGDRVAATFFQGWIDGRKVAPNFATTLGSPLDGMLAEEVVLSEEGIVPFPAHLSYEEAACLPCAGLTAWHALMEHRKLMAGEKVLVLGTGGVSIFALHFARMAGARVFLTSSSDDKIERAKAMGSRGWRQLQTHARVAGRDREAHGRRRPRDRGRRHRHVRPLGADACLWRRAFAHRRARPLEPGSAAARPDDEERKRTRHLRREPPDVRGHEQRDCGERSGASDRPHLPVR